MAAAEPVPPPWFCDTNGASLPVKLGQTVAQVAGFLAGSGADPIRVGIHGHNDTGCAVANSLIAVEKGATHVQGTINGYGERCGNADLCSIIPALKLKMNFNCISDQELARLTETSRFVSELCNVAPDPHQPYVGRNAFAHKGGLHVAAIQEDRTTFEHIRPELVGNTPRILVSELAGKGPSDSALPSWATRSTSSAPWRKAFCVGEGEEHHGYHFRSRRRLV